MTTLTLIAAAVAATGIGAALRDLARRRKAIAAALLPKWVPEAAEGTIPRPGSRRWARALYHNKMLSLEELNSFCASHPEDFRDPDR